MIPHSLTLSESDGSAVVIALSFETRRVIVRWGDAVTAHVSAYRLNKGKYGGWEWRRESVPHGYRLEALAGPAGDRHCQDLGEMWDCDVEIQPAGIGTAALESWLRVAGWSPLPSGGTLRGVCRWLARHKSALVHGWLLFDDLALESAVPIGCGGNEVDDLLGGLLRAGVVALFSFDPKPVFSYTVGLAATLDKRVGSDGWSACGAKHWYFKRGPRWSELPAFD